MAQPVLGSERQRDDAKPGRGPVTSMEPIPAAEFGPAHARHLLNRAGFGGSPEQVRLLASWGAEKSVDYLLDPSKVPFDPVAADAFDKDIMRPLTAEEQQAAARARRSMDEDAVARLRLMRMEREREDRRQMRRIQEWWLARMIATPRPLEEKMTLFFHGHFATSYRTIENSYQMFKQNQMFRSYAIGNFGKLLYQIIRDPAMLAYLDQNDSRRDRPNENLAREIMELFALGIGNYTEDDIKEGARALTGYTFQDDEFVFNERQHDPSPKKILGASGTMNGDDFVTAILRKSACTRFLARKLYHFFVADLPPLEATSNDRDLPAPTRSVLSDIADEIRRSRYELKPVLRTIFLSRHFYDAQIRGQQIKSPVQLVVGSVRSLNTPARDSSALLDAMDLMGQNLFYPPSVKGWDGGRSWINTSTMFVRQNTLVFLLTGRRPGGRDSMASQDSYDPMPLLRELAKDTPGADTEPRAAMAALLRFCTGAADDHALKTLMDLMVRRENQLNAQTVTEALTLITAMPEYQLC